MCGEDEDKLATRLIPISSIRKIPYGFKQRLGRVAEDERKSENDGCEGYQRSQGIISIEYEQTSKYDEKKCNADKNCIELGHC